MLVNLYEIYNTNSVSIFFLDIHQHDIFSSYTINNHHSNIIDI
jgi:hypothetical protein